MKINILSVLWTLVTIWMVWSGRVDWEVAVLILMWTFEINIKIKE